MHDSGFKKKKNTQKWLLVFYGDGAEQEEWVEKTYISTPSKNDLPMQCMDFFIKQACR